MSANMRNGAKLGAVIGAAFAFMSTFFGGGWATGSQAGAYYTQHGWTAFLMPLGGLAIICICLWLTVEYSRLNNTWNYAAFMERFYGSPVVRVIFDVIQILTIPISFGACVATFASTLQKFIGGSYFMWVLVFAAIVIVSVMWGTKVVNTIASVMGLVILVLLTAIFIAVLATGNGSHVVEMVQERTMYTNYGQAFYWGVIKFAMLSAGLGLSILPSFEVLETRKDVTKTALWSFLFSGIFLVCVNFSVQAFAPEAIQETLPMYYAIETMELKWLIPVYVIVVSLAVITTGNAMCYGYGRRFAALNFVEKMKGSPRVKFFFICVIILAISAAVSMLGLTTIIYKGYTIMSYLNTPLVALGIPVVGILKLVQIHRRGYSLERGALEHEKSWAMFSHAKVNKQGKGD